MLAKVVVIVHVLNFILHDTSPLISACTYNIIVVQFICMLNKQTGRQVEDKQYTLRIRIGWHVQHNITPDI